LESIVVQAKRDSDIWIPEGAGAPSGSISPGQELEEAVAYCTRVIAEGSKSFSLASRLFNEDARRGAVMVYGWCRLSDDRIDQAQSQSQVTERLAELRERLDSVYRQGRVAGELEPHAKRIYLAFGSVISQKGIPAHYPQELLEGMAMDARGTRYVTYQELRLYCYRVASTVGLMMCHVMGVRSGDALRQASDLGMAMQLTNIARDVREDFGMGRVYLPEAWLKESGVDPTCLMDPSQRAALHEVVTRLLDEAERLYASGQRGISELPFQAALAVQAALYIYREIGREILRRGPQALERRTVISRGRKLGLAALAVLRVLGALPARLWDRRGFVAPVRVQYFEG